MKPVEYISLVPFRPLRFEVPGSDFLISRD